MAEKMTPLDLTSVSGGRKLRVLMSSVASIPKTGARRTKELPCVEWEDWQRLYDHDESPTDPRLHYSPWGYDPKRKIDRSDLRLFVSQQATERVATISQQGGCIKSTLKGGPRVGGGTRGKVKHGMSRQSRHRACDLVASIDHFKTSANGCCFITLTFKTLPPPGQAKKMLFAMQAWLSRKTLFAPIVWSQELGERFGRLHFHLIVYSAAIDPWSVEKAWSRASKGFGGWVKAMETTEPGNVCRYLCKYVAKGSKNSEGKYTAFSEGVPESPQGAPSEGADCADLIKAHISTKWEWEGRAWGVVNRKNLVIPEKIELAVALTVREFDNARQMNYLLTQFLRFCRRKVRADRRKHVRDLAGLFSSMGTGDMYTALKKHPNWSKAFCLRMNANRFDPEVFLKMAWATLGKSSTRYLHPTADWKRFTFYCDGPSFDVFAIMEWITVNLPQRRPPGFETGRKTSTSPPLRPFVTHVLDQAVLARNGRNYHDCAPMASFIS